MRHFIECLGCIGSSILLLSATAQADTSAAVINVSAKIENGCMLGSSGADVLNFGTINFGTVTPNQVKTVTSAINAGSIVLRCTPGLTGTIALNAGANSTSILTGRKLKHTTSTDTLTYQLFSNAGYTAVWGNDTGGTTVALTPTGGVDEYKIYAKLMSVTQLPEPGTYNDTITVTITY